MIKIGHVADIKNDTQIPESIKSDVISVLMILDECYGSNRNIDSDMGGFVVICENSEQFDIPYFDISDVAEYTEIVGDYEKSLYISGTERNVVVYRNCIF